MRNSNHNLLKLMTFADYFDSVFEQVSAAVTKKPSGRITIELTEYVLYCLQLLENNGYPPAAYADEIQAFMWQASCCGLANTGISQQCGEVENRERNGVSRD